MTAFPDLSAYAAMPRVTSLRLAPDGTWLAATVQTAAGDPPEYVTSIWRIATQPGSPPARLTRSAEGEGTPEFLPDGSLLFASPRPAAGADGAAGVPGTAGSDAAAGGGTGKPALWLLPAGGGEAWRVAAPPGGVSAVAVAGNAAVFACAAGMLRRAAGMEDDAARRKARKDAGVNAILHEDGRIRYWDHDLGPDARRLLAGEARANGGDPARLRDLTPEAGRAVDEQAFGLTPDGSAVVTGWVSETAGGGWHVEVVTIDAAAGAREVLLTAPDADFEQPRVSPDGRLVLALRSEHDTYDRPGDVTLVVAPFGAGDPAGPRDLLPGFDRRPVEAAWAPDSAAVYFTADDQGRCPVFRADLAAGDVVRLTGDDGAYEQLCPSPDGRYLYALRSAIDAPPAPVRIDLSDSGAAQPGPVRLNCPGGDLDVPGRLDEVSTTAADGTTIRGWLVLPPEASADAPAPLVLWVHGGPVSSWNAWSWRWNPWLMAARGYAVLLPDPALSTGYGQHMIQRGHGTWGDAPYSDVMAITDAVVRRPDIDASRTAMMGGSFGGYMANGLAGHTDRFAAIVSHAGLWALDQMLATTDWPAYWRRTFGDPLTQPERYLAGSPHLHVAAISTPMLVIHGDKDYRVPVGEALRLWADLTRLGKPAKFLYFPDENHWILKPGDVPVWYETVFAFLAEHVLGEPWKRPELL